MNKRIKQLADRATQYADGYDDRHEPIWWHFYNKRFAELIVEECCVVMNDHDSFYGEVMMSPLIKNISELKNERCDCRLLWFISSGT